MKKHPLSWTSVIFLQGNFLFLVKTWSSKSQEIHHYTSHFIFHIEQTGSFSISVYDFLPEEIILSHPHHPQTNTVTNPTTTTTVGKCAKTSGICGEFFHLGLGHSRRCASPLRSEGSKRWRGLKLDEINSGKSTNGFFLVRGWDLSTPRVRNKTEKKQLILVSLIVTKSYKFRNPVTNSVWYISPAIDGFQKNIANQKSCGFTLLAEALVTFPGCFLRFLQTLRAKLKRSFYWGS